MICCCCPFFGVIWHWNSNSLDSRMLITFYQEASVLLQWFTWCIDFSILNVEFAYCMLPPLNYQSCDSLMNGYRYDLSQCCSSEIWVICVDISYSLPNCRALHSLNIGVLCLEMLKPWFAKCANLHLSWPRSWPQSFLGSTSSLGPQSDRSRKAACSIKLNKLNVARERRIEKKTYE